MIGLTEKEKKEKFCFVFVSETISSFPRGRKVTEEFLGKQEIKVILKKATKNKTFLSDYKSKRKN